MMIVSYACTINVSLALALALAMSSDTTICDAPNCGITYNHNSFIIWAPGANFFYVILREISALQILPDNLASKICRLSVPSSLN